MRLIDADKLKERFYQEQNYYEDCNNDYEEGRFDGIQVAIDEIVDAPTVERRKHGHWEPFININGEKTYRCSTCQNEAPHDLYGYFELTNYCPHCGAKMEGVK